MRYSEPALVEHLAAAYALGTLGAGARRRFERLARELSDVALALARWESRLGRLAQSVPPVQPAERVWRAIEARTRPLARPVRRGEGWLVPAGWELGGLLAGVAGALALFMADPLLFVTPEQAVIRSGGRVPPSYVGVLADARGNGRILVSALRRGRTLNVKALVPIEAAPEGRQLVLWAVPTTGRPVALGPVPLRGSMRSALPDIPEKLFQDVSRLVVTSEPLDQALGVPGPVLYSGNCARLW